MVGRRNGCLEAEEPAVEKRQKQVWLDEHWRLEAFFVFVVSISRDAPNSARKGKQ